ncbi:UDP-N-acetylmuramoyl-L-alanyl-D-glutamate--2,6-diaminopimelate ligase [Lactobacillus sp. CC-MHH1034]|uniref:UDP-N-acetylmuramoyl-L-alanyl-D-glutamate--2, 6-diaminopimelate ligase n=1 Tax=Agrilactobacillus fermenti TaxID=2586909 RepID=UPI001E3014F6|nr:UDP-N-acetylmuramoyl-L-alanyl-D-glutamate--2,6-diaminopimelate ligase [Agrilactobacillus fermenti]MCD2255484.1 UDP-N-acetylmuramoyl-L-alanyl-D-glutamate--2,6-diaminopimelate ligase [Agrilactobacillus fermenti]
MSLSLYACMLILKEHHLLKSSAIQGDLDAKMVDITYDSRKVKKDALFFCKGDNFRPIYLTMAKDNGAITYVAEQPYPEGKGMNAFIVTNIQKAMALLSAAYFDYPQDDLFVIAYTGTKGKTTSAYFTKGILDITTNKQTALFSTIDRILGPKPEQRFKSDLTTPESLDLFHDMRAAVDNGMTHLIMEVSSQAYLRNRVFGLTYDVGFFLNITPDHIGPNEHPNFDNYLHCKLQLLVNSRKCVINAETDHFDEVYAAAKTTTNPDSIYLYAGADFQAPKDIDIDFRFESKEADLATSRFNFTPVTPKAQALGVSGAYQLSLIGDFNESNATAAIIAAAFAGADTEETQKGIANVRIPGRMESLKVPGHGQVYVDYAHNYASMKALLSFLKKEYNDPKLIVVVGSPGDKGVSRRPGFAKVLTEYAQQAFLTTDDPGFENPQSIVAQIDQTIDHNKVNVKIILDRKAAIKAAITMSQPGDIVVLAGKGADPYQKVRGVDTPYPTDLVVAKQVVAEL